MLRTTLSMKLRPNRTTTIRKRSRDNVGMDSENLEQIAAVIVTAGLVAGNFLLFTPWRNGEDPRQRNSESLMLQNVSVHPSKKDGFPG